MKKLILILLLTIPIFGNSQTVLIDSQNCVNPIDTITETIDLCLDYGSLWAAAMNYTEIWDENFIITWWDIVDTTFNSVIPTSQFIFQDINLFTSNGCHQFNLILNCPTTGESALLISTWNILFFVNIDELSNEKSIVNTVDLLGRNCKSETNRLQIIQYNNGTTKLIFKSE